MITCMPKSARQRRPIIDVGRRFLLVCAALGLIVALPPAIAQSSQGSISGSVSDEQGAAIRGAKVKVTASETHIVMTTESNDSGLYIFPSLNPGDYGVSAAQTGFQETVVSHVTVSAAQKTTIAIQLKVGRASEIVTVTAQDSFLTKEETNVVTTVDHQIVEELPYPERSSLEAALLVPGVNGDPLQPGGISTENPNAFLSNVVPGASISVGGGAPGTSSIYVDGSDVTQASFPRAGINLSGQMVRETSVVTTGLSAKYGRTSSGVIIQNSASGTDHYHGSLSWRHNDPFFNAYPFGASAPGNSHENFYGVYLGGPVRIPKIYNGKARTFFYVGIEPARLRSATSFRATLFTPDELAGNLNNSLPLLNQKILKTQGAAAALAAPRVGGIYYQSPVNAQGFPYGPQYTSSSQYQLITGPLGGNDVGPQLAQNPLAKFVLSHLPTPSNPGPNVKFDRPDGLWASDGSNAVIARGAQNFDNRYSFRIDHQIGSRDQLWGRFTSIPLTNYRFYGLDPTNPIGFVPSDSAFSKDAALGYAHVFSSNIVNNLHYSYLRVTQNRTSPPSAMAEDYAAKLGLTPAILGKGFPTLGNFNSSGIGYSIAVGPNAGNPTGIQRDQNFILGDDLTWIKGKHVLQFGADIRWIQSNQYDLSGLTGGKYTFSQGQTNNGASGGLALATFILGSVSSFSNTPVSVPGYYRWKYYAGYLQDDWRVRPNLTLNIGVRYGLETPRSEANNNQAIIRLDQPGALNGMSANAAFCFADACGGTRTLFPASYSGIEPRVGISYAPTSHATIRASYGILHIPLSGYENTPDPNFNVGSFVGYNSGGSNPSYVTNYITNPIGAVASAYTSLNGARGPLYYVSGVPVAYVGQSNAVPYTQTYSLTVQYEVSPSTILQASYQGLKGTHLIGPFTMPLNAPTIGAISGAILAKTPLGNTIPNPYGITQNGVVLQETLLQSLNPYQNFFNQNINVLYPRNGRSAYNGLYISVNHRFSKGLSALANYTWQKSLDDVSETNGATGGGFGFTTQQNPFDLRHDYSVSGFDQASRLKYGFTYDLPFGKDRYFKNLGSIVNAIMGNIKVAAIGSNADGVPTVVTLGSNGNFYSVVPKGVNGCSPSGSVQYCINGALPSGYTLRPNIVPGVPLINPDWKNNPFDPLAPGGITPYLNINAFAVPGSPGDPARGIVPTPAFGNAPRTLAGARSPREMFCDLRVSKGITFAEGRYHLNLSATLNNAFNHPVYYGAGNTTIDVVTTNTGTGIVSHSQPARFATLNQGQTGGISRVVRIGAEFAF